MNGNHSSALAANLDLFFLSIPFINFNLSEQVPGIKPVGNLAFRYLCRVEAAIPVSAETETCMHTYIECMNTYTIPRYA